MGWSKDNGCNLVVHDSSDNLRKTIRAENEDESQRKSYPKEEEVNKHFGTKTIQYVEDKSELERDDKKVFP